MTHPELVKALCKPGEEILRDMSPQAAHRLHMVVGICGEAGEVLDIIKKNSIYHDLVDINHLIEELGDIEFYLEGLRQSTGITREETITHNIEKLTLRYGTSYSNSAAQARLDKQSTDQHTTYEANQGQD